jgi:co-chaperonin GroES (HSP10)
MSMFEVDWKSDEAQERVREIVPPDARLATSRARARAAMEVARYQALPERLRPLRDEALVVLDAKEHVVGSLVLPDISRDQPQTGTVLAVGPRCDAVQPGDRVLFGKWNGKPVLGDWVERSGYGEPDMRPATRLYVTRPVFLARAGEQAVHAAQDEIAGVIEEEG